MKTNATRLLDKIGIPYTLREYSVDPEDLSAPNVAAKIGMACAHVFKTLVARVGGTGVVFAVVPGDKEVDLRALARLTENRRAELVPVSELRHLTGYVRGGVTALACKKPYPVYLDNSAATLTAFAVSAGARGIQIVLAPADYIRVTTACLGAIARPACVAPEAVRGAAL